MKHLLLFFLLCYAPVAAQVAATSPHQPKSTTLTTLSGFTWPANAPGVLTNNGTNTLTYTGTTTGGMAGDDDGKLPLYYNSGWLMANKLIAASTGNTSPAIEYGPTSIGFVESSGTFIGELQWSTITANRTITLPNATGTVVTTGNLSAITTTGTITSGTWQGTDIALGYIAQGGATDGQAMVWNNGAGTWAPGTVSGGTAINLPLRAWVESTGNDGTGAVGNPAKPYLTMQAAYTAGARELYLGEGTFAGITKAGSIDVRLMGHGKSKTSVTLLKSTDGGDVSVQDLGVWSLSIMTLTTERAALTTPGASGLAMGSLGLHNVYIVGNVAGIGQDGIAGGAGGAYPGGNGGNGANLTVFGRVFIGGTLDVFGGLGGAAGDDGESSDQNGGAGGSSGNIIVVGSLRVVGVVNAYGAGGGAPFLSGTAGAAGSGSNISADEIVCDATLFMGTADSTGAAGTLVSRKAYINVADFSGSISSLGSISGAFIVIGTLSGTPETTYALRSHINGTPIN